MASPTRWTWLWVTSGSSLWTGKPSMLQSIWSQDSDRTERLNWTEEIIAKIPLIWFLKYNHTSLDVMCILCFLCSGFMSFSICRLYDTGVGGERNGRNKVLELREVSVPTRRVDSDWERWQIFYITEGKVDNSNSLHTGKEVLYGQHEILFVPTVSIYTGSKIPSLVWGWKKGY